MTQTTRNTAMALLVGCLLLSSVAFGEASQEPFALYEDWTTASTIRSDRWNPSANPGQEIEREVQGNRLRMRFRRAGGTGSDSGSAFFSNRLDFRHPLSISQIEAELRVKDVAITGCPTNATASIARAAAVDLLKISDLPAGTSSAPGDLTGDYIGRVEVRRLSDSTDPDGILTVRALVFRCDNPACTVSSVIGSPALLGQVRTRELFRVRLMWNAEGNEFHAGLRDAPDVSLPYPPTSNARPANNPLAALRIQHLPANCTAASGGPTEGDAEIEIRAIRTNASAVIQ